MTAESLYVVGAEDFLIERPFGEDSALLLKEWFNAARLFIFPQAGVTEAEDFRASVNECFQSILNHSSRYDQHLFRAHSRLYDTGRRQSKLPKTSITRAFALLHGDFLQLGGAERDLLADPESDASAKVRIFSPLYFLRRILTSDDYLASSAYAHAVIRAEIFASAVRTFNRDLEIENIYDFIRSAISFKSISESLTSIQSYRAKRDIAYMSSPSDFIVGNLLASYGYATLAFARGPGSKPKARRSEKEIMPIDDFLDRSALDYSETAYEIHVLQDIELPTAAQLLSELDGIPLGLPGWRTIFSGGIRGTDGSGAVIRVTGKSGTGKTTLALSACVALAPLGTRTFYLSCEEEAADLLDRLHSVTPPFVSNTRTYAAPDPLEPSGWFNPFHLSADEAAGNFLGAMSFVDTLLEGYVKNGISPRRSRPPGLAPFVVVLDGVHELITRDGNHEDDQVKSLHELVDKLRHLNALIILLSADIDSPALRALDYLVDVVISLDGESDSKHAIDNLRTLRLQKTRRQFSYAGTHRYHISRSGGARIFPSLPATLDQYKRQLWHEPDRKSHFDFLLGDYVRDRGDWLRIYRRSHVLVTGRGSTGKASFALRLLTAPLRSDNVEADPDDMFESDIDGTRGEVRRILIVSFLYPKTYYDTLMARMRRGRFVDRRTVKRSPQTAHTVLPFYPGGMPGEVLLSKITEELRRGHIQGVPYDGVLIDGLHNVFLQFPSLENDTLIWPILSEIFRRSGVTVAITHAHFDVIGMDQDQHLAADIRSMSNRSTPLLQSLVNSADYYIDVSPLDDDTLEGMEEDNPELGECALIRVGTALGQPIPRLRPKFWNRSTMSVRNAEDLGMFM